MMIVCILVTRLLDNNSLPIRGIEILAALGIVYLIQESIYIHVFTGAHLRNTTWNPDESVSSILMGLCHTVCLTSSIL